MMKIRSQILSLFVLQQSVSGVLAFIVSPGPAKTSTALPYRINENEAYQRDQFIAPFDIGTFGASAPPRTMVPPPMRRRGGPPPPPSRKMYDLSQRKRQAARRGAVQGAIDSLWGTATPKNIQGNKALKTWTIENEDVERVQVLLKNDGTPLAGLVEVWTGPDSTPQRISVRSDNGMDYPFSAVLEVPPDQSSIAIRNLGPMEFPMGACVVADVEDAMAGGNKVAGTGAIVRTLDDLGMHMFINGEDSMESFRFEKHVESVQVLLKTDGRPLHARLELVQGPNDSKQTIDIFSENGETQPFFAVIDTPGASTIRVINTAPSMVFPLTAVVEPYMVDETYVPPSPEGQPAEVDVSDSYFFLSN
ncbi:hypothetical protein IV203_017802 [Nitzschia inconspicua]|uniref:Uncharacterized protein n=1 Tax=Nitzschia inconspicua TaxID=303405 RepID=A0A9K3M2B6_9STRA|nr:hypothetical protein IV203_024864 [Nitzschia inconspicua]KAG7371661.1 hypothetical protein IV203_017802 [Nitzschia inconspicua]